MSRPVHRRVVRCRFLVACALLLLATTETSEYDDRLADKREDNQTDVLCCVVYHNAHGIMCTRDQFLQIVLDSGLIFVFFLLVPRPVCVLGLVFVY